MLSLSNVHSYYGQSHILNGVNIEVNRGEVVTLVGRNGMGKTTTLKSIMGLVDVRGGSISYKKEEIANIDPNIIFRKGIGYVPQGRKIFSSLTVSENLTLGMKTKDHEKVEWVFGLFPRLRERRHHWGNHLSGGEQQMLAIARVLVCDPEVVLLDEPSEGLAPMMIEHILETMETLKSSGMTLLLVEANLDVAIRLGDRHYVMNQGRIVREVGSKQLSEDRSILDRYLKV